MDYQQYSTYSGYQGYNPYGQYPGANHLKVRNRNKFKLYILVCAVEDNTNMALQVSIINS